jgi:cytoskeletal protein CcmA (bactofilin family)
MFKISKIRNNNVQEQAPSSLLTTSTPDSLEPDTPLAIESPPVINELNPEPPLIAMSTPPIENLPVSGTPIAPAPRTNMMDMLAPANSKPSILSEGFSFRGEINAKGAIHVEGSLNGQIQVNELTIGAKGSVEGVVSCHSLHIKGKFAGTAICNELIVTSSASVDGHVVYQTLSVQKGASIKGELLLDK